MKCGQFRWDSSWAWQEVVRGDLKEENGPWEPGQSLCGEGKVSRGTGRGGVEVSQLLLMPMGVVNTHQSRSLGPPESGMSLKELKGL